MKYLFLILFFMIFFYFLLPAIGAFISRASWRRFRLRIVNSCFLPIMDYKRYRENLSDGELFRFFGTFEAVQDDDHVWIRNESMSVTVNLLKEKVYILPSFTGSGLIGSYEDNISMLPDEQPRHISWSKLSSLPLGTRVFVCGPVYNEDGIGCFRGSKKNPLTVVLYDGDSSTLLRRTIWNGRQKNEYWNPVTPGALLIGALIQLILAYWLISDPLLRIQAAIAFLAAGAPVLPFLPPGLLFFYFYTLFWKKGRYYRAERDLLKLPLRYFNYPKQVSTVLREDLHYIRRHVRNLSDARKMIPDASIRRGEISKFKTLNWFSLFGVSKDGHTFIHGKMSKTDPMVEPLIVVGDPLDISIRCSRNARRMEILSAFSVILGLVINAVIMFLLILRMF